MIHSDLTADLPAPRDDEPASLRNDIVDELRDHLECALRREQLKTESEPWGSAPRSEADSSCGRSPDRATDGGADPRRSRAFQRVLERFGNPRAVARKLWWDAMQERIMAQRFTAVMTGIGAAACVAACLVLWQFLQASRASQAASLAEMRDFNAKLLAGLQRPAESPATNSEWARVLIKLVDAESGAPVSGATGQLLVPGDETASKLVTTDDGLLDFGTVPLGKYQLFVNPPGGFMGMSEQILIGPETPHQRTIRVPQVTLRSVERIRLKPQLPLDGNLRFLIYVQPTARIVDGREWNWTHGNRWFVVSQDGRVEAVLGTVISSGMRQNGRFAQGYTFADDAQLPSLTLRVAGISVVEPLEDKMLQQFLQKQASPGARGFAGFHFASLSVQTNLQNATDTEGQQPELEVPQTFWEHVTRAEIRAGLKPPPDGMQIVTLDGDGSGISPGMFVDIRLTFLSIIHGQQKDIRLVKGVEVASMQDDPGAPEPRYSLLVSDEQSKLLNLAKSAQGGRLNFRLSSDDELVSDPKGVDPEVVEVITREVDAAKEQAKTGGPTSS
jgi:hypothetical protein